jgi:pimeloyl-ACP methyl ester carboxylesterase
VNGVRTRYREAGRGSHTIVLIHGGLFSQNGLCMSSAGWDATVHCLASEFHVYAPDTLGQGHTDPPSGDAGYTIGAMIDHLKGFLDCVGTNKPHLVGHDEGAMLAVRLAFELPQRVASCSIVDSAAVAPVGDGLPNATLDAPLQPTFTTASQRWILDQCLYNHQNALTERFVQEAAAIAATPGFLRVRSKMTADDYYRRKIVPELAELRLDNFSRWRDQDTATPMQLIWGYQDRISLVQNAEVLHNIIAARSNVAQLHYVNRSGYLPFMEEPRAFSEIIRGFVRSTS